jgi:hypothetical protein
LKILALDALSKAINLLKEINTLGVIFTLMFSNTSILVVPPLLGFLVFKKILKQLQ